ncbi:hypothetical protein VTK73DRAFT_9137 [Phialemonium thermophilum]|uniref:Secreted protein n=1 Tax=Phialemonium thermophilum TaxID=223376 RepID=A0ABR3XLG8_9PEZI
MMLMVVGAALMSSIPTPGPLQIHFFSGGICASRGGRRGRLKGPEHQRDGLIVKLPATLLLPVPTRGRYRGVPRSSNEQRCNVYGEYDSDCDKTGCGKSGRHCD